MEFKRISLADLVPYENNPRINDYAVEPVMESIRQCGYVSPIIVDENNVILAGHTRFEAMNRLEFKEADCVVISGLSEEQKRKYRILDNKTSELAEWDEDLLKGELQGIDLGGVHWFDDLLNPNIEALATTSKTEKEKKEKVEKEEDLVIRCPRCGCIVEGAEDDEYGEEDDEEITWSPDEE